MTEKLITNRYRVISKLGQGGMGAVWHVYDRLEKSEIALKQVLIPDNKLMFASKAGTADTERLRLSLAREFSILASLRHPNILSVLDYGFDSEQPPYFTMPLVAQPKTIVAYGKHLALDEKVKLVIQMLQAVHYLHRRGILHRDLKPDNVLVTQDGEVKVLDFGLSVTVEQAQGSVGTLPYIAPEVLRNGVISPASDLYAVGLIAYELFAGQFPYPTNNAMKLMRAIMNTLPDMSLTGHTGIETVLMRLLPKDPDDRFQSAEATIRALREALEIDILYESIAIRESFLQASTFVGRDVELRRLTGELNLVLEGRKAFYLVGGESGVGKSRLLDELRINALVSGALVLRGQAVEGGGLPFQLWRNIVQRLLLLVDVTALQAGILKDIVSDIEQLLEYETIKPPNLSGKAHQERIVVTIVNLILAVKQPLVLLLEDLQWTGESLTVLKQLLLAREQFSHLMVVGSYRNDEASHLPDTLEGIHILRLERLDMNAIQQLSTSMLGQQGATEQVVELLQNETEGNIFFLVETVRALAEEAGSLESIGKVTLPHRVFTSGMQQIMQRRLNKVEEQYQPIQALAAVIGREIDIDLLAHQHDLTLVNNWLINASEQAILDVQDNTWQFAHDKLRETILTDMDAENTQHYHHLAAEAIEATYPDNDAYNEILLNHWHDAGNLDRELHYAKPILESYLFIQDRIPEAEILIEQSLARLPENDGRRVFLLNWLTYAYLWFHRDTDRAEQLVEQAYQLAKVHDDMKGLAFSTNQLGNVAKRRKHYQQAEAYYKQSLAYDKMIDSSFGVASNLLDLGQIAQIHGDYQQAKDYYEQSIAIQDSINDQRGKAVNYSHLGLLAFEMGDYDDAETYFQQGVTLSQIIKHQTGIAHNVYRLATAQLIQSKVDKARDGFEQAMPIFEEINFLHGVVWCLNGLCRVAIQKGDTEQVVEMLYQSLSLVVELDRVQLTLYTLSTVALYYSHNEHHMDAMTIASFVVSHPPYTKIDQILLDTDLTLATFEATLSDDDRQVAVKRSRDLVLEVVVKELLDVFSDMISLDE